MRLLSWFKRSPTVAAPPQDTVERARSRARHRLIGAVVLVIAAVIVFPMLFETEPRQVDMDIPIELRAPETPPALALPPGSPSAGGVVTTLPSEPREEVLPAPAAPPPPPPVLAPPAQVAPAPAAPAAPPPPREPPKAVAVPSAPPAAPEPPPAAKAPAPPAKAPAPPAASPDDAQRARALLEGREPASGQRFVVQVGAYADADKVREVRAQLEGMGLKTYTQVVQTAQGPRTRVRLGPFASRALADEAAARVKAAGLPMAVLSL